MKKTITSLLALAAMLFAINVNAQDTFKYEFQSYVGMSYENYVQTVDVEAISAAIGYPLAEATIYAVQSDGTLDPDYQLGTTDGWKNELGDWSAWGETTTYLCVKFDATLETEQFYYIGGHHNVTAPATYEAKYKVVNPTDESKYCFIVVSLTYKEVEECLLSNLEIVGEAEKFIDQYPRATGKADADSLLVADLLSKLGAGTSDLNDIKFFVSRLWEDAKTDSLTMEGFGSWDFCSIYDEDTGNDLPECGVDGTTYKFFVEDLGYDLETAYFYYGIGQESTAGCKVGDQLYSYIYVVFGNKAYKLKLGINIVEKPEFVLEKVGQTDITVKAEVDNNYGTTKFTFSFDEILEALGCTLDDLEDVYAWAGEGDMSDNHTEGSGAAQTSGYYLNDAGYISTWGDASAMFINFSNGIFTDPTYQIGQMSGHFTDIEAPTERVAELVFTYMGKYWVLHITYIVTPEGWKEEGEEDDPEPEWECVQTLYVSHQHLVSATDYTTEFENFDFTKVAEALGTENYGIWTYKAKSDSTLVYNQNQTMGHCNGFWMGTATYDDGAGRTVVDNAGWGNNSFGICFLVNSGCNNSGLGEANQLEFWGRSNRTEGEEFTADIFFMDETNYKYVQLVATVKYVTEKEAQATQVGAEAIYLPARSEEDPENGAYTTVDLTAMYEALGCTAEEFAEGGQWLALNGSGQFTSENYDELEGFFLLGNGTTTADGDELLHAGYCADEDKFFSWIIDDANLENSYQAEIRALYGDKFYSFTVNVGKATPDAINSIAVNAAKSGNIYDLSGRLVKNPAKGLYIINGKKVAL